VGNKIENVFKPSEDCLPVEELVLTLEGRRGGPAQQRREEHMATCLHCASQLALLRRFESAKPSAEERADVAAIEARLRKESPAKVEAWWKSIWQPRILTPLSVALAAVAIVMVIYVQKDRTPAEPSVGGVEILRSAQVRAIGPFGDVAQAPGEFRWQAVPGANRYRVRVAEVDRTELWRTESSDTSVKVPKQLATQITPMKKLIWEVMALDGEGRTLGSSGLQSFRVRPGR
jgi:hypothetical protein